MKTATKTTETKSITAEILGTAAFLSGKQSAPCLDKECMKLLEGNEIGEGLQILEAWLRGWHTANINAPIK